MNKMILTSDSNFEDSYKSFENIELRANIDIVELDAKLYSVLYELILDNKSLYLLDLITNDIHTKDSLFLSINNFFSQSDYDLSLGIKTTTNNFETQIDLALFRQKALYKNIKDFLGNQFNNFIDDCNNISKNYILDRETYTKMFIPIHVFKSYLEERPDNNNLKPIQ